MKSVIKININKSVRNIYGGSKNLLIKLKAKQYTRDFYRAEVTNSTLAIKVV